MRWAGRGGTIEICLKVVKDAGMRISGKRAKGAQDEVQYLLPEVRQ